MTTTAGVKPMLTANQSVFDTPFFTAGSDGKIQVLSDFWILWVIGVPISAVVLLAWMRVKN